MRGRGAGGAIAATECVHGDNAPLRCIERLAWANEIAPPLGHIGIAGQRVFHQDDVIPAVRIAEEMAEAVVGDVGIGKRGACFGAKIADTYTAHASALNPSSRSAMMSSISSMPTDNRMVDCAIPAAARAASSDCECVVVAG